MEVDPLVWYIPYRKKNMKANAIPVWYLPFCVVLKDEGPWDQYPTITNDVEAVLERVLERRTIVRRTARIFYIDSEDEYAEIIHEEGKFIRFAPFPSTEELLTDSREDVRKLGKSFQRAESR